MANNRTDGTVEVDATLDPSTVADLSRIIEKAITHGFELGFKNLGSSASGSEVLKVVNNIQAAMNKTAPAAAKAGAAVKGLQQNLSLSSREAYNLTKALQDIGAATKAIAASQYRARTIDRAAAITAREQISRDAQFRIETLKGENARAASAAQGAAQEQVVSARYAGKQRVLITQEALRTIGRLEKGLGVVISSTARTITSGLGSAFNGLTSIVRRHNNEYTNGLTTSLHRRESIMSESFSRQERTVRNSVIRQERQLNELRTATSRGVLGAVSGRGVGLGIAGLIGGFSFASALKTGYDDAVNFGEQVNKSKVVFGQFADQVFAFAKRAPSELGATRATVIAAAANFGNLFKTIGLAPDVLAPMSTQLVKLATDISSFNNTPIEEVFVALKSGLVGESEPLRNLGIDVSDATLKIEAMRLGIYDGTGTLTQAQKAQAAYSAILRQTTDAQGDFNRTADEGANAARRRSAAFQQLVSDITGKLIPAFTALNLAGVGLFSGLSSFVEGDVGPALLIIRDALKGAAAGLGAVAAAKGGVEVLRLVGTFAKLAATPMGVLLVSAGLLGAAISVLSSRSKPLRDAFGALGDRLEEVGKKIADKLAPVIEAVQRFIDEKAIPALTRFADFLGRNLMGALDATIGFITGTAIPAVVGFATSVADVLGRAWGFASDKAIAFFNTVKPYIQPAIDGFKSLGKALSGAFGGDFSGLRTGAANALGGIGSSVANIAGAVGKALLPVAKQVGQFFVDLFSVENVKKYASAFLSFVEEVGRIIGSIVSSPPFLAAVGAIAAAAVVIGFRFVEGLAKGILSNIPNLLGIVGQAIADNIGKVLLVAVSAIAIGPKLIGLFKRFGSDAGAGFSAGLKSSVTSGRGFLTGLFGGNPAVNRSAIGSLFKSATAEAQGLQNSLRVLGSSTQVLVSPSSIASAKAELARLKEGVTDAQLAGLRLRDTYQQAVSAIKGGFSGLGNAVKAIGPLLAAPVRAVTASLEATNVYTGPGTGGAKAFASAFSTSLRAAGTQFVGGLRGALESLRTFSESQGQSIGRTLAQGVQKGSQVGLAAVGGFLAGRAEGEGGGSGLLSAATAGLTGLAVGGPVVGAVAAGASLIGTAFGKASAEAKKFKESVKQLTSSLKDELLKAVDNGTVSLTKLKSGLVGFSDVAGLDSVAATFRDALGGDGVKALDQFGLTFQDNILPIVRSGGDLDKMKDRLRSTFLDAAASSDEFRDRFGKSSDDVKAMIADLLKPGGGGSFTDLANGPKAATTAMQDLLQSNEGFIKNIIDTAGDLTSVAKITKASIDDLNSDSRVFGTGFNKVAIANAFDGVDARAKETAGLLQHAIDLQDRLFNPRVSTPELAQAQAISTAASLGQSANSIVAGGGPQVVANANTILNRDELSRTISEALKNAGKDVVFDDASARAYVQPIIDAYVAGFEDPGIAFQVASDLQSNLPALFPTVEAANAAQAAQDASSAIQDYLNENFPQVKFDSDVGEAIANAKITNDQIIAYVADHPSLANVSVNEQAAALVGIHMAGIVNTAFGEVRPVEALGPNFNTGTIKANARTAGTFVGDGFIEGIGSKVAAVAAAAARMAREATAAANRNFGISSPSKVFMEMGKFVGLGLAKGIEDTEETITSRITSMLDNVIETAKSAGSDAANAMRQVGVSLFGALVGPGASLNTAAPLNGATIAITNAFQGLLSSFDSQVQQVFAVGKKADEFARGVKDALPLTPAEQILLNENNAGLLFSFNPASVLGSGNLSALSSAFEAIAGLGEVMINQGSSANEVASALSQQVDALATLASSLGFSVQDVYSLADALGLSSDALASFVEQVNAVQEIANSTQGAATAVNPTNENGPNGPPPPLESPTTFSAPQAPGPGMGGPENSQNAWVSGPVPPGTIVAFENNIYLPTGDPEAAALAVVNAQAQRLFV